MVIEGIIQHIWRITPLLSGLSSTKLNHSLSQRRP